MQQRGNILGAGATIVRTPQDALAVPGASSRRDDDNATHVQPLASLRSETLRPESRALPPLPAAESPLCDGPLRPATPPRPVRAPPPPPETVQLERAMSDASTVCETMVCDSDSGSIRSLRSSLKTRSPVPSVYSPPVPELPANISCSPPPPPFEAILLSPPPTGTVDPARVIVTLETGTVTQRTTLRTLLSRPSFLATYLQELIPSSSASPRRRDSESTYSQTSDSDASDAGSPISSIFQNHLASSGLLPQASTSMHIFLDRPSAPYTHILNYLRTPPGTPEHPAALPHAAKLSSGASARLDALLELRDEARFLDLEELYRLCCDEVRARAVRPAPLGLHVRGFSSGSGSSASLRSVSTLRDIAECDDRGEKAACAEKVGSQQRGRTSTRPEGAAPARSRPNPGWI
ncbi:hypothetical protein WOLCODRAFT_118133 [Wolfiporia cocos MD-104 SS10]|uniref:BTB domain-containing protein n=1 Tax=Wolfiporia cocos (strain MD-104) TaxID=742152 RepID=A0A2H3JXY9_WOLCO|nr:hypothetical protein WOLCODRAFT_118133 [Wolfiporia cocos MD-104 SS10]